MIQEDRVAAALADQGYAIVEGFIDRRLARILYDVLLLREWRGESTRDEQASRAASHWGDSTLDAILVGLLPDVEMAVGCALLPTCASARLYMQGDALRRHRERAACEIAVTIHLGHNGTEPPPIRFAPDVAVTQQPGDAVVYRGDRIEHWRETFQGWNFGQVYLSYVRADGERRGCLHDGRRAAFPPSLSPPRAPAHALDDVRLPPLPR
jgi:hypothetical protein